MAEPTAPRSHLSGGTLTALIAAALVYAAFVWQTSTTPMPDSERWAALTSFGLLTLALTLQGSAPVYDALGATVRRDWRALAVLGALLPTLYLSYSMAVREFRLQGLLAAVLFAAVPTLLLLYGQGSRRPLLTDAVAMLYLLLSLSVPLLPTLELPRLGGQVSFFTYAAAPLLLVLLAARAWSGVGFTWYLTARDLRLALLVAVVVLLGAVPLLNLLGVATTARPDLGGGLALLDQLTQAILIYALAAIPHELLLRGFIQRGIAISGEYWLRQEQHRQHDGTGWRATLRRNSPALLGIAGAAVIAGLAQLMLASVAMAIVVGWANLGYGYVYWRTGKVTAAATTHMLVVWILAIIGYHL
jgi:hypothetical protein